MRILFTFLFFMFVNTNMAQFDNNLYSKVKIDLKSKDIKDLAILGIEVDHGYIQKGKFIVNDYSQQELQKIREAGFSYEVLIEDVKAWYKNQNRELEHDHTFRAPPPENCFLNNEKGPVYETPINYTYGSMGGYLTYSELLEVLDSMVSKYPNLISARAPIGTPAINTWMGNNVLWLRISDNPNVDEMNEPEVLFTSLHHAREPNSLSQNIFYMWYLLENYDTDSEIKYLVDNTEIYFIPCINPDGYILNEMNDPNGGGLIRKNGRDNNGDGFYNSGQDGVDLNRNYAFQWGFDNIGSSPSPNNQTYRGPSAASEPETQAVQQFCNEHEFLITLNYHTFGNLLIHPWGYTDDTTSEHATFQTFGEEMTQYNNYVFGTGTQTVGYTVNGDSDDWMYGETVSKGKIYSMTPEAGDPSGSFWPMQSQIDGFNKANMHQNLSVSRLVLNYVEFEEQNSQYEIYDLTGSFEFNFIKKGLQSGGVTVGFESLNPNLTLNVLQQTLNLNHLQTQTMSVPYTLNGAIESNEKIEFVVSIDNGLYTYFDTIVKTFIDETVSVISFTDNTNNLDNWVGNTWGLTNSTFYSAPNAITDSPNGNYNSNQTNTLTLANPIDLTSVSFAKINFWARWQIENDYDYVQVRISTDNGASFIPLCGSYSNEGTIDQDDGMPLYDDNQLDWVYESIDISEYVENEVLIQFYFVSDGFVEADGFYFDDFEIEIIRGERAHNISIAEFTCDENEAMVMTDTFQNIWGLDSIYTVNTIFIEADETIITEYTTNESEVGTNTELFQNIYGCDSVVITETKLDLSINIIDIDGSLVTIYPNPIRDHLHIELGNIGQELELEILNTIGQRIAQFRILQNQEKIVHNMTNYNGGIYFVNIKYKDKVKTIKFLKL